MGMTSREVRRFGDGPAFCRVTCAMRPMRCARRAFSLAEILIVLTILAALSGSVLSVGAVWGRPTAAQEADRAMRWLYGVVARADLSGRPFGLGVDEDAQCLQVRWEKPRSVERLPARSGLDVEPRGPVPAGAQVGPVLPRPARQERSVDDQLRAQVQVLHHRHVRLKGPGDDGGQAEMTREPVDR